MTGNVVFKIDGEFEILDSADPNVWIVNSDSKEIGQVRRVGRTPVVLIDPASFRKLTHEEQIKFSEFIEHIRE